jgi:alkyldihydroxyacetonephosphate synthase
VTLSHWGWGREADRFSGDEVRAAAAAIVEHLGFGSADVESPVPLEAVALTEPRLPVPSAPWASASDYARALHHRGRSYTDVVRGFRGLYSSPPDVVARPGSEAEVEAVLEWAADVDAVVVPFGGGTSVVGGVEVLDPSPHAGVVALDLHALDRVLEVDPVSRAARIQAGAPGPVLEAQLAEHGLTLRHYPQSFELSTLGGWIATRAGGHFATNWTHIDDLVESVRAMSYAGAWESRRLPGSGAGPSPDRALIGSEGILGVITEAWVRVQARPTFRSSASVADHDVAPWAARAREICGGHGGEWEERGGGAGAWRSAFLRAPYLRDVFVACGVLSDTFETAITWDRFADFHASVTGAVEEALGGEGWVTCRFTHVYPDGPAPYFTVLAPARRGDEVDQWAEIKAVAAEAVIAGGGTITHHHAVGRDHRPWYDRQRPEPFAAALRAAKTAVDPDWRLNPGVLVDP